MYKASVLKKIKQFADGDKKAQQELIAIIILQFSKQIIQLSGSVIKNDWLDIKKSAHFLTSTFIFLNLTLPLELTNLLRNSAGLDIELTKKQVRQLIKICKEITQILKEHFYR